MKTTEQKIRERGKRMTVQDWDDVADLFGQFLAQCETAYEEHTVAARQKAARWCDKMQYRAHDKARVLEAKTGGQKKLDGLKAAEEEIRRCRPGEGAVDYVHRCRRELDFLWRARNACAHEVKR